MTGYILCALNGACSGSLIAIAAAKPGTMTVLSVVVSVFLTAATVFVSHKTDVCDP